MSVTAAQNLGNLTSAANLVASQLGVNRHNLTTDQQAAYNKALAAMILKYPDRFTDSTLETARIVAGANYGQAADTGFDWGMFETELTNNVVAAGGKVAAVGDGVLNTAALASWLIPTVALAVVGIWLFKRYKAA